VRVLFAAHQFFPEHYAGVETVTLSLAQELGRRGHEVHVLAPKRSIPGSGIEPGEVQDYEYGGIPVRRVGRPKEGVSRPYRLDYENGVMAERTSEYLREIRPDVVHAEHFQGLSASVIPAIKESGAPLVYTATDFWTFCPVVDLRRHDGALCRGPEVSHCTRCIASRYPGTRMKRAIDLMPPPLLKAAGVVSETPLSRLSHQLRQVRALKQRPGVIRTRMEGVDRIIVYTELMRGLLLANGIGEGRIEVSHYGIDTSGIERVPADRPFEPPLRVGFVGTLAPHKGCDVLVRAFRELPRGLDATLHIYGNLERFKSFVGELRGLAGGDERIDFAGPFGRDEVGEVLAGLDVLVVPSRWYENGPGVIFEAHAAGIPVVATDLGGMSEFVRPEKDGLLFDLEDHSDLARQLRRLAEEPGLLQRLRSGIQPVKTVQENVDELEELYDGLLKEDGPKGMGR
jgi:glycosyltransferase involved in cell wall biosynthesis